MIGRIIASISSILVYGWVNSILYPVSTLLTGQAAGAQLENSDKAYLISSFQMNFFSHIGISALVLLVVILAIWWVPLKNLFKDEDKKILSLVILASAFFGSFTYNTESYAYYDTVDKNEVYFILPNESAFWVPDVGANKDSQVQMNSLEYFQANKVATKLFKIPHVKFSQPGIFDRDYYVPAGRLIVVNRAPYYREWKKSKDKGTSSTDQSLECQSSEGINMTYEFSIVASVSEQNAAKFLYNFGLKNVAVNRSDMSSVFASVFQGKSLEEVMDGIVRVQVLSQLCGEVAKHDFVTDNLKLADIVDTVRNTTDKFLSERGVKLESLGLAGTVEFDKGVQDAINQSFASKTLAPSIPTLQAQADIRMKNGLADGFTKFGLPNLLPPSVWNFLNNFLGTTFSSSPTAAKSK